LIDLVFGPTMSLYVVGLFYLPKLDIMATTRDKYLASKRAAICALRDAKRNPEPDSEFVNISQHNKFTTREFGGLEHGKIYRKAKNPKSDMPGYAWGTYF